jgi:hypothetical protein
VYGNKGSGIRANGINVQVKNNIAMNNGVNFSMGNPPVASSDYNLFFDTRGGDLLEWANGKFYTSLTSYQVEHPTFEQHSLQANPGFMNDDREDFRLRAVSPAVDAGVPIALFNWDLNNQRRPAGAWAIGAYEIGSGPSRVRATSR